MTYDELAELAATRMIDYVDRIASLDENEDQITRGILMAEIKSLANAMDNDEEILAMTYHRALSNSYGILYEIEHGDSELCFGHELP